MAQVPYQPDPTVTPEANPTRPLRINANEEMFGAGVGNALSSMGATLDRVSDKFFQTAVNFRKLDIENEVNQATTDFFTQSGELDNKFRQMEGGDPQKNLTSHTQALTDTRESIRNSLTTDFARKMYDRETMRRLGYDIVNAGNYAATQAKQFNRQTRQASVDSTIDTMTRDPGNLQGVDDGLRRIHELVGMDSTEAGESPTVMKARVQTQVGRAVDAVAKTLAKTDPDKAKAFLERYKDFTHSAQYQQTMEIVEERGLKLRAELEGARIATPLDNILYRAAAVTREQESGGDYGHVTTTKNKQGQTQQALGAYGIMDFNLPAWSKEVLGREVSKEEFLANKDIQDQIYFKKMGDYIRKYGVEGAGRAWIGGEGGVNNPTAADPLGTRVGDYGRVFATKVGTTVDPRNLGEGRSIQDMMQDAETSADLQYPNDPVRRQQYLDTLQKNILTRSSVQQKEVSLRKAGLNNALTTTLNAQMPNGRGPVSFLEAGQLDPHFQDNYDALFSLDPKVKERVEQHFLRNGKQDVPYTPEREANYARYLGMTDEEFAQQDFNKAFNRGDITLSNTNKLIERQAQLKHKSVQSILVDRVLAQNGSVLNDARIFQSRDDTAANRRYQQFRGSLILRMEEYAAAHNAPMPQKEADQAVKDLLKDVVTKPGMIWGYQRAPAYQAMQEAVTINAGDTKTYNDLPAGAYYKSMGADGKLELRRKPGVAP